MIFPPYVPHADNDSYSRREFYGQWWWDHLSNIEHFMRSRGRLVANERFASSANMGAGLLERARVVFDATPEENLYLVRVRLMMNSLQRGHGTSRLNWRVDSEDTAGLFPVTGETPPAQELFRDVRVAIEEHEEYAGPLSCSFPHQQNPHRLHIEAWSQWMPHFVDPGLGAKGRVLRVFGQVLGHVLQDVESSLRGVTVVGFRVEEAP